MSSSGFSLSDHGGAVEALCRQVGVDPAGVLDFSVNVNPLGPPPQMLEAMRASLAEVARYPALDQGRLCAALAAHAGADSDWILAGNGSSELLYLMMNAWRPRSVGIRVPAYADYERAARSVDAEIEHFTVDLRRALAENDLLILGSPNNPTGKLTEVAQIVEEVRARPDCRVVVDHAFFEFVRPLSEMTTFPIDWPANLISLRSLTKFYAIPGMRLGYVFARPEVIADLAGRRPPWSVNCAAQAAALCLASLGDYAVRSRELVGRERGRITRAFAAAAPDGASPQWRRRRTAFGAPFVFPSTANFVLIKLPDGAPDAGEMQRRCLRRGVLIRDGSNFTGLDRRHIRVAVRLPEENDRMIAAVREAMEG